MHIAICEDNEAQLQQMHQFLSTIISQVTLDAELSCFQNGDELLAAIETGFTPSVCFLDIYMEGTSGVDTAWGIKAKHHDCAVIFVTGSPDHMADGFEIGAVHYLQKPIDKDKVEKALYRALETVGQDARYVELTVNRQSRRVLLSEILYAESQGGCCYVYVKNSEEPLRVYMKLDVLEALFSHCRFLRCHHSYLVNLDAVTAPTQDCCFLLQNGTKIPIRQRSRKEILSVYNDYYFEQLRRGAL